MFEDNEDILHNRTHTLPLYKALAIIVLFGGMSGMLWFILSNLNYMPMSKQNSLSFTFILGNTNINFSTNTTANTATATNP